MKPTKIPDRPNLDAWEYEALIRDNPDDLRVVAELALKLDAACGPGPWSVQWESCDCSDGLCSHGYYPYSITLQEPTHEKPRGSEYTHWDYEASEISSFKLEEALLIAFARTALPKLARAVLAQK